MHLSVAVEARSPLGNVGGAFAESGWGRRLEPWNLRADHLRDEAAMRRVALMTEKRWTHLQHAFHYGAVWIVAIRAILAHRLMVVHEGTAFFGVTLVASINHAIALHQFWRDRTMGIVTIRASDLALKYWVTRGSADLGTLRLVTGEADFKLGCLAQDFILGYMN